MKTLIVLEITHAKEVPSLGEMIAGRAYTISGVSNAECVRETIALPVLSTERLEAMGFSLAEISLGAQDVVRS